VTADQPRWNLPVPADGIAFADQYLDKAKKTLLISACSSHVLRNWNADGYAAVADFAIEKLGMQVVLSGGPSALEKQMAAEIESRMRNNVTNLVGRDTLQQLVGLLSKVDVVISPDSGPAHIASALGTPVIGLYACTWSRRSGPYNSLAYCVDKFEIAARTYRGQSAEQLRWGTKIERPGVMDLIEPDEVMEKLKQVIAG
jgi:heptosyltransferase I